MQSRDNSWCWLLGMLLGLRLLTMAGFPLTDTTEARYAEIARKMAVTGDWITPWFADGIPFWGKPPLAFWGEAMSFKLLGFHEFAARFPSWVATLGTLALIHTYALSYFGRRVAMWAVLVYATTALAYILSGAVLTDPFLALATTWAMVAFAMALRQPAWGWRYGFFAALAVGLLAKGPLMWVLVAGALIPWLLCYTSARESFRQLPWFSGLALMAILSAPWYVMAELKTPGFLNYFLVGEHFLRFIDSGWTGDMYGTAHEEIKGMIWIQALIAAFPWGVLGLIMVLKKLAGEACRQRLMQTLRNPDRFYLMGWLLFPMLLFTFAGNILWTYVLPALAAFSVLVGISLADWQARYPRIKRYLYALAGFMPLLVTGYMVVTTAQPHGLKTEKELVAYAYRHMPADGELIFIGPLPFSAVFYSQGQVKSIPDLNVVLNTINTKLTSTRYLAIPKVEFDQISKRRDNPLIKVFESRQYILAQVAHSSD